MLETIVNDDVEQSAEIDDDEDAESEPDSINANQILDELIDNELDAQMPQLEPGRPQAEPEKRQN